MRSSVTTPSRGQVFRPISITCKGGNLASRFETFTSTWASNKKQRSRCAHQRAPCCLPPPASHQTAALELNQAARAPVARHAASRDWSPLFRGVRDGDNAVHYSDASQRAWGDAGGNATLSLVDCWACSVRVC